MAYYCHLGGSFNSYSLGIKNNNNNKKMNSVDATYRPGESPSPHALNITYHNVTTCKRYLVGFTWKISCFLAFE